MCLWCAITFWLLFHWFSISNYSFITFWIHFYIIVYNSFISMDIVQFFIFIIISMLQMSFVTMSNSFQSVLYCYFYSLFCWKCFVYSFLMNISHYYCCFVLEFLCWFTFLFCVQVSFYTCSISFIYSCLINLYFDDLNNNDLSPLFLGEKIHWLFILFIIFFICQFCFQIPILQVSF